MKSKMPLNQGDGFMSQDSAARFFKAVQQDEALAAKLRAIADPATFVKTAADLGYLFSLEELEAQISKLSAEEIAAVINPGVGPRRHLVPR
jgi:predicted ribosomally synthesized peptide with nif11-like leader